MPNTKYFESPEEFFDSVQNKQEIEEYIEAYQIGGFDIDDKYSSDEYNFYDVDNYAFEDDEYDA